MLVELLACWYRYDELGSMARTSAADALVYLRKALELRLPGLEQLQGSLDLLLHGDRWLEARRMSQADAAERERFEAAVNEYAGREVKHPQFWWALLGQMVPPEDSINEASVQMLADPTQRAEVIASLEAITAGSVNVTDPAAQARVVSAVASVLAARGRLTDALRIRENEELPLREKASDIKRLGRTLMRIGELHAAMGALDSAVVVWRDRALPLFDQIQDRRSRVMVRTRLRKVYREQGALQLAAEALSAIDEDRLKMGDVFPSHSDAFDALAADQPLPLAYLLSGSSLGALLMAYVMRTTIPENSPEHDQTRSIEAEALRKLEYESIDEFFFESKLERRITMCI